MQRFNRILTLHDQPLYTNGILAGLQELGYIVRVEDLMPHHQEMHSSIIHQLIDDFKPDLVFNPGWCHDRINLEAMFEILKSKGIPHVYWASEDPTFHRQVSLPIANKSIFTFTTTEEYLPRYRRRGLKAELLQFGCNPSLHKKWPLDNRYVHDIVLVAHNYVFKEYSTWLPFRLRSNQVMVTPLVEQEYDLRVWGLWWNDLGAEVCIPYRFCGGTLDYQEMPKVYSSAKIVLGVQFDNSSRTQTSCRPFEALACGAFHLTICTPSLQRLFRNHRHLVWSNSAEETRELADYYLHHHAAREKIALAGQREVYRRHTYKQRASSMMSKLRQVY
ncbi:MAG: CgeB family protein [Bacillota bacterium]